MLKEEEIKEVVDGYNKIFAENFIEPEILYDADTEITIDSGKQKVIGAAFGINKIRFATYPHIECKLINEKMQEVANILFIKKENFGEQMYDYDFESVTDNAIIPIESFGDFLKDIKLGKVKASIYLNEKKRLLEQLDMINELIEKHGIKEE